MKNKKGISLIVLIVTIIVIIILAAAVILTLSKNNPIESAREATFKEDVRAFQDELALSISKEYTEKQGQRDKKITTSDFETIKKYIPSFTEKYKGKFVIENDKLVGTDKLSEKEVKWSQDLSVVASSKAPVDQGDWDDTATNEKCFYWDGTTITGFIPEKLSGVTKVRIPTKCTAIRSDYAWGGTEDYRNFVTGITEVELPDTVTIIGRYAFHNFTKLTNINIPSSVKSIEADAFNRCSSLTNVVISEGVTNVENSAFSMCTNLTSVTISKGVDNITAEAFSACDNLTNIIVDKENPNFDSRNNCNAIIKTSTNELVFGCKSTIIPESVTSIGCRAFSWCYGLTSITIPKSVTSIGEEAFVGCNDLTSINIPDSVKSIGNNAFSDCNSLTSMIIPESVTSIGSCAFCSCDSLTDIKLSEGVISIDTQAFYACNNLTNITIPSTVTSIGEQAFIGCYNLTINCRAESQPSGWHYNWNPDSRPVNWRYTGE